MNVGAAYGKPCGAGFHGLTDDATHLCDIVIGCFFKSAGALSHGVNAHGVVTDHDAEVDRVRHGVDGVHIFGESFPVPGEAFVKRRARNIFDEDPPTTVNIGSPFYTNYLHDIYGRVPYVRYEQDL